MPRPTDIPPCPDAPALRSSGRGTSEYRISLVSPLFGGGVEAGMPDESMPIRGTSIRGQLQFWWRATRGASHATHEDLFARHSDVWGNTDKASPVEIDVRGMTAIQTRVTGAASLRRLGDELLIARQIAVGLRQRCGGIARSLIS